MPGTDLLLVNCHVHTMDAEQAEAGSVLVRNGRVHALDERPSGAREIDLGGRAVVPGFFDSHAHMAQYGMYLDRLDLLEARNMEEALGLIRERIAKGDKGPVVAVNFDETRWREGMVPTREELDSVSTSVPIVARRICGHLAVANSLALEHFDRDQEGVHEESGLLLEGPALDLDSIFPPGERQPHDALRRAIARGHALGITGFCEMTTTSSVQAFRDLALGGGLKAWVRLYLMTGGPPTLGRCGEPWHPENPGWKHFLDGSLGAHTAALSEPYADAPGTNGELLMEPSRIRSVVEEADRNGTQLAVHAIGDRAVHLLVSELARAPAGPLPHRVEHLELAQREDLDQMAELGLIASMQPNFAGNWSHPGGMNETRLGKGRWERTDAFRDVLDAGVELAFGSDSMPPSPLYGIASAVHHPVEGQRLTVEEAVRAYTIGSAGAAGLDTYTGSLSPGKSADLVVLSSDPFKGCEVSNITVEMTMFRGEWMFRRSSD